MKKLLTIILVLCSVASFGQMRGGAQYDPGAARKNLSNVDASATPSMTSITLSDKVQAAWANILGNIYASGTVKAGDGTAAAPAYTFSSDPDTGIYRYGNNELAIAAGGKVGLRTSAGVIGMGTAPSTMYQLDVTGVDRSTTQRIVNTSSLMESSATQYRFGLLVDTTVQPVATGTTNSGYVVGARYDSYMDSAAFEGTLGRQYGLWARAGIYSGTGTITNCYALYLTNFNNTGTITNNWGIYQDTAAARNYFAGRTLFGTTTDDGVSAVQVDGNIKADKILAATGTAAAPAYTFSSDPDTGIYSAGADVLGFGVNGAEVARMGPELLIATSTDAGDYSLQNNGYMWSHGYDMPRNERIGWLSKLDTFVLDGTTTAQNGLSYGPSVGDRVTLSGYYGLSFATNSAESMRITNTGNVLIATSTDDGVNRLQVNGGMKAFTDSAGLKKIMYLGTSAAVATYTIVEFDLNGNNDMAIFTIDVLGTKANASTAVGTSWHCICSAIGDLSNITFSATNPVLTQVEYIGSAITAPILTFSATGTHGYLKITLPDAYARYAIEIREAGYAAGLK